MTLISDLGNHKCLFLISALEEGGGLVDAFEIT